MNSPTVEVRCRLDADVYIAMTRYVDVQQMDVEDFIREAVELRLSHGPRERPLTDEQIWGTEKP